MANTKTILGQIKIEGALRDVIAKSDGENVTVSYEGSEVTLSSALSSILTKISSFSSGTDVDEKIATAIGNLIDGAPETYNTLKEIADYIASDKTAMETLNAAIGNKVSKEEGKGLSAEDFTTALKTKLDSMPAITETDVNNWNAKADKTVATTTANGLMSAADKVRLDGIRGVRYGTEIPADLQEGELFIQTFSA